MLPKSRLPRAPETANRGSTCRGVGNHQSCAATQTHTGNHDALVAAAEKVGLEGSAARVVLESDRYAEQVRFEESLCERRGQGHAVGTPHLLCG